MKPVRRILLTAAATAALIAGVPAVVMAATGTASSHLDLQASRFTTTTGSTSSGTMTNVPGLAGLNVCALGQVTAVVSVEVDGARPVGVQVLVDGGPAAQPGAVRLVPAGAHDSGSFTFTQTVAPFEANDHHTFDLQWRSPNGGKIILERGSVVLLYQQGTQGCLP
jgi:hypothetical protein